MTALVLGLTATATQVDVSDESLNVARPFLVTIDSETMRVRALSFVSGVATRWTVDRGIDSTPATHAGGATVTLGDAAGPGGAAEAGTAVFKVTGAGTTTGRIFIGDVDPADVPAYLPLSPGEPWIDTISGLPFQHKDRNATNDGWNIAPLVSKDESGNIIGRASVTASGFTLDALATDGALRVALEATSIGVGLFSLRVNDAAGTAVATLIMDPDNGVVYLEAPTADISFFNNNGSIELDPAGQVLLLGTALKFGGQPVGTRAAFVDPTTATAEDIANAMIATGLMAPS